MRKIQSVLYVDDDADICEVVKTTLCVVAKFCVHTAASGEQAIDLAREVHPDLVLMDIMMPGLDGPSTLRRMRNDVLLAHIPVIFMTAKLLPAEVAHFLRLGAIGVIGKPFDPLTLSEELWALWSNAGKIRETAAARRESPPARVQGKIASLTDGFLARTAGDVARLREMIARVRNGERSALWEVERVGHKIHGSGAVFGFPQVSASGAVIERLVKAEIAAPDSAGERSILRRLLQSTDQLSLAVASAERASHETASIQG